MKTMEEVRNQIQLEVLQWFKKQMLDLYSDYYVYYQPAKNGNTGGIVICKEIPVNPEYVLGMPEKVGKHLSIEQNIARIAEHARRWPILSE